MILRKAYLDQIIPLIDKDIIKVLTGVRRSGKTVLLQQIQDYLLQHGRDKHNIVYISFESKTNAHLKNSDVLYSFLLDAGKKTDGKTYIFLDEIQTVPAWEEVVSSLLVDLDCGIEFQTAFGRACDADRGKVYPDPRLSLYFVRSKGDHATKRYVCFGRRALFGLSALRRSAAALFT